MEDQKALMGMGATDTLARVAASIGLLTESDIAFKPAVDVPCGGVLFALPALLSTGLLRHARPHFSLPKGYYGLSSIFLVLAFMALSRLRSVEQLRYVAPGEWGKLVGLDRIPEVRTLRGKIATLQTQDVSAWRAALCEQWMQNDPESCGVLYVDGHVRVYHGHQTKLPRHYVARQRLCLRATTDYWVNALDGQPFFYVNKTVDPGLIQVLEDDIVPRLQERLPQAAAYRQACQAGGPTLDPWLTLIFDREGYSPALFKRLDTLGIACISYHKFPQEDWAAEEFHEQPVTLISSESVVMSLAERGTQLSNRFWVRQVRKRISSGKQIAILCTHKRLNATRIASRMFGRWSQENFFKYMRQEYGIDKLISYHTEDTPGTTRVVNPAYRSFDAAVRKKVSQLTRQTAAFGALQLKQALKEKPVAAYTTKKTALHETITALRVEIQALKDQRKETPKHISFADLPEPEQFKCLSQDGKQLIDTIKIIAYRSETAMAQLLRESLARVDDARNLLRAIYQNEADLLPNYDQQTLTVSLHHLANNAETVALSRLCDELNATQTNFPGSKLRLIYQIGAT